MKTKYFIVIGIMILLVVGIFLLIPQETITITELPPIKLPAIVIP